MASGGHLMDQQRRLVERRLDALKNDELKGICRAFKEQVSGTKAVLQARCTTVLNNIVRRGDVGAFEEFKRVGLMSSDPGLPSLLHNGTHSSYTTHASSASSNQYNMAATNRGGGVGLTQSRLPAGGKCFKPSPFYEVLETLLPLHELPDGPDMPQNRHTIKANLVLKPEIANQFRSPDGSSNLRILLYCGVSNTMSPYTQADVAFPNQIEVKVNDNDIKHNFKGLKNKPGSTKPADVTSNIRKFNGQANTIQVTYALTTKRFAFTVCLVRSVSADSLVERIKKGNIIPKDKVLQDMSKANADPDIAATSIRMSLKDPVSTVRISLPVRSSNCTHNQCFDGGMFLQLQEQAPQWSCPVCSKTISFESLCIDKYFEDILNKTSKSTEKVDIEPNGSWKIITDDQDTQQNGTSNKGRASYDDDFDDIVELDPPISKPVNGVKKDSFPTPISPFSNVSNTSFSFNTPPLTSREPSVAQSTTSTNRSSNKRPQSSIIDLTLSDDDDEDEPPRPAKRHSTIQTQRNTASASATTPYDRHGMLLPLSQQRYQQSPDHNTASATAPYDSRGMLLPLSHPRYQQSPDHISSNSTNQADTLRPMSNGMANYSNSTSFKATNSVSPTNPTSPFAQPTWPQPPSRSSLQPHQQLPPPTSSPISYNTPFAMRPSSNGVGSAQPSGLRLPPMQTHPSRLPPMQMHPSSSPEPNLYEGWRSDFDYGSYSQSPG